MMQFVLVIWYEQLLTHIWTHYGQCTVLLVIVFSCMNYRLFFILVVFSATLGTPGGRLVAWMSPYGHLINKQMFLFFVFIIVKHTMQVNSPFCQCTGVSKKLQSFDWIIQIINTQKRLKYIKQGHRRHKIGVKSRDNDTCRIQCYSNKNLYVWRS